MKNLKIYSKLFDKKQYIAVEDFTKTIREVEDSLNNQMQEKISELKKKYASMEKEYRKLQVEHSRLLFDMDAVIEHEVDVKCKILTAKFQKENKKLKSDVDVYKSLRRAYKEKYLALLRANTELDEENRKLREELEKANEVSVIDLERVNEILQLRDKIERLEFDVDAWHQLKLLLEGEIEKLKEENKKLEEEIRMLKEGATLYREDNKKLRETIKDHQLYEEKLEHRIIEFEELLHGE